jgi:hypothetical protein
MEPLHCRIVVRGQLSERFAASFDGMAIEPGLDETAIVGRVRDQAHLYGVLERLPDLGLELVRVERTEREASNAAGGG